jgi:hypothetical protein
MAKRGGKMAVSSLKQFILATYKTNPDEIMGYKLDKSLSTLHTKIYWDDVNKRGVLSERPTHDLVDVLADVTIALDFTKKLFQKIHPRFKSSWSTYDKVDKKYSLHNFVGIAYSLGSYVLSEYSGLSKFKEVFLVSLPVVPGDILTQKDLSKLNITNIKSKLDAVGFLDRFVSGFKRNVDIKPGTYNPIAEHKIKNTLPRLDQDMQIGDPDVLTGLGMGVTINNLKITDIKNLIKKLRRGQASKYPITGKNKQQLLDMLVELVNEAKQSKPRQRKKVVAATQPAKRTRKPRKRLIEII